MFCYWNCDFSRYHVMIQFPCGGAAGELNTAEFPHRLQLIAGPPVIILCLWDT